MPRPRAMRRTVTAAGILLMIGWVGHLSLGTASSAYAAELKIGYINLAKIFDGYQKTKASDATLQQRGKQKETELEDRMNELKKLRQNLELLSDQAREAKAHEVEEKADELNRFRTNTARDLGRERDKVAQQILADIYQAIEDYGKANGFTFVLDTRSLLYAEPAYDVTDKVLALLNSRAAGAAAAAPTPKR